MIKWVVIVALIAAGGGGKGGNQVRSASLLEILIEADGMALRASLHNRSSEEYRTLHHPNLQPSRIELVSSTGKAIVPFDERTRRKFDRTVREGMFAVIEPHGKMELGCEQFEKTDNGYELRWGPYLYQEIPAGFCKVRVVFESAIDQTSNGGKVTRVWKGKAKSNEIIIQLP